MAPYIDDRVIEEAPAPVKQSNPVLHQQPWSEPVPFGGEDDQWFYIPESKRFDLSRGAPRKLILDADDGVHNHRGVLIDPKKTALIIIDMQNYFIHPTCHDHRNGIAAVEPTLKVIERCRSEEIEVIWLNWGLTEADLRRLPPAVTRGFNMALHQSRGYGWNVNLGTELPDGQGRCLFKGTWNADIYPPLKAVMTENDRCFDKCRMSGLWSPDEPLHRYLRETGKKTLMFAGVNTDQCLLGTLTDAYSWGWDCIFIADCAGTMTGVQGVNEVTTYNIATNMGFCTDSKSILEAEVTPYHVRHDSGVGNIE